MKRALDRRIRLPGPQAIRKKGRREPMRQRGSGYRFLTTVIHLVCLCTLVPSPPFSESCIHLNSERWCALHNNLSATYLCFDMLSLHLSKTSAVGGLEKAIDPRHLWCSNSSQSGSREAPYQQYSESDDPGLETEEWQRRLQPRPRVVS